jgi:hypothetical protein
MDMDEVPPAPAAAMVAKGGRVGNAQVLSNIRNLKAYCLAAYDKAADLKNDHPSMSHSSLVHFIENFGKPFRKKKKCDGQDWCRLQAWDRQISPNSHEQGYCEQQQGCRHGAQDYRWGYGGPV